MARPHVTRLRGARSRPRGYGVNDKRAGAGRSQPLKKNINIRCGKINGQILKGNRNLDVSKSGLLIHLGVR